MSLVTTFFQTTILWFLLTHNLHINGRRSVDGQGDIPLLFEVQGTPSVFVPYFFGVDVFVQMHMDDWSNFR